MTDKDRQPLADLMMATWSITAQEAERLSLLYSRGHVRLLDRLLVLSEVLIPDDFLRERWFSGASDGRRKACEPLSPLAFLLEDRSNLQALVNAMDART